MILTEQGFEPVTQKSTVNNVQFVYQWCNSICYHTFNLALVGIYPSIAVGYNVEAQLTKLQDNYYTVLSTV